MANPLDQLKIDLNEGKRVFRPIHESWADWMLECVPPIRQSGWNFMNCEPLTHNDEGEGIYFTCIYRDKIYYGCYCTLTEWDNRTLNSIPFSEDRSLETMKFGD